MQQLLKSIGNLAAKTLTMLAAIALLNLGAIVPVFAATNIPQVEPDIIQPFELTNPAATRAEAYDDVAKLNKNPKELIAAENKEEKAEEKLYEQEQKSVKK